MNDVAIGGQADIPASEDIDPALFISAEILVDRAYRLLLDREPDPDGLRTFTLRLATGQQDIRQVASDLLNSQEATTRTTVYDVGQLREVQHETSVSAPTIAAALSSARVQIATLAGVDIASVRLDLHIGG